MGARKSERERERERKAAFKILLSWERQGETEMALSAFLDGSNLPAEAGKEESIKERDKKKRNADDRTPN